MDLPASDLWLTQRNAIPGSQPCERGVTLCPPAIDCRLLGLAKGRAKFIVSPSAAHRAVSIVILPVVSGLEAKQGPCHWARHARHGCERVRNEKPHIKMKSDLPELSTSLSWVCSSIKIFELENFVKVLSCYLNISSRSPAEAQALVRRKMRSCVDRHPHLDFAEPTSAACCGGCQKEPGISWQRSEITSTLGLTTKNACRYTFDDLASEPSVSSAKFNLIL